MASGGVYDLIEPLWVGARHPLVEVFNEWSQPRVEFVLPLSDQRSRLEKCSDAIFRARPAPFGEIAVSRLDCAVSNFGADASFDLAAMLETTAKEKDFERSAALVARLEAAVIALERRILAAMTD